MPTYNKAVINGTTYLDLSSDTVTANSMLNGVTAHDKNGASITGSIPNVVFPSAPSSSQPSTGTNKANWTVSTSPRWYALPAGYLSSDIYYYFRPLVSSGITAANIKDGATITVGDDGNATRIFNVTGTFTDASTVSSGQTAAASSQILSGYSAWVDGAEVQGNISNMTLPTTTSSSSSGTSTASINVDSSNRYINIPAGYLSSAHYYLIRGVRTSGISAGNIKYGAAVQVGDTASTTRLLNVTGTFTGASTVSSGQTAATAAEILEGYSAWVDGVEVQGTATGGATCEVRNGGATWAQAVAAASTSVGWREEKYSDGRLIRWAWDYWNANAGDGAKTVAMTAKASDNNGPTAFVDTPECFFFQRSTGSTAVSASITLQSWSNTTHTYYMFFSNNGSNRRIAVSTRMEGHWK